MKSAISLSRPLAILAFLTVAAFASTLSSVTTAAAEGEMSGQKMALVIGNQNYQHITPLETPLADVKLVSESFKTLGFDVTLATDLSRDAFNTTVREFARSWRR
jgi:hypothetical protein